jgi:hypothetical protein
MTAALATFAATAIPHQARPRAQTLFRGSRILTGLILAFSGVLLAALASRGLAPAQLLSIVGVLQILAAVGVWMDRGWGFALAIWVLAAGVFVVVGGIVLVLLGLDPLAGQGAGGGLALLVWTLFWYGVAAWALQRTVIARQG